MPVPHQVLQRCNAPGVGYVQDAVRSVIQQQFRHRAVMPPPEEEADVRRPSRVNHLLLDIGCIRVPSVEHRSQTVKVAAANGL